MGRWRNFEELEENLALSELYQILDSMRTQRHEDRKFAAALKGVNLDEAQADTSFEDVKRRAEAKLRGMTEEQYELTEIGIGLVEDE